MKDNNAKSGSNYFDIIEVEIGENDKKITDSVNAHGETRESLISLIEKKHVFKKLAELVRSDTLFRQKFGDDAAGQSDQGLNFLVGTIKTTDIIRMKRMIHRISRGRAIASFYDLEIDEEEYLFTTSVKQRGFSFAETGKEIEKINTFFSNDIVHHSNDFSFIF